MGSALGGLRAAGSTPNTPPPPSTKIRNFSIALWPLAPPGTAEPSAPSQALPAQDNGVPNRGRVR